MRHQPERFLSLRVTPETRQRLDAFAAVRGVARHRVAVEALRAGLDVMAASPSPLQSAKAPEAA